MRSIDELASEICTLAGHINAANHRWLLLVAEYDRGAVETGEERSSWNVCDRGLSPLRSAAPRSIHTTTS
jgi:hypothetical protein